MAGLSGGVMLFVVLAGLLIAVLWILLPFSVFGTKPLLRQLIAEQKRTNALLTEQSTKVR